MRKRGALLLVTIILTVTWGFTAYWHYQYVQGSVPGIRGTIGAETVFPFWIVALISLIGYLVSLVIIYLLISAKGFWQHN